ncbi:MAG: hypothetical protein QXO94_07025 [Candidatus Bathyarchaeia archaeon]
MENKDASVKASSSLTAFADLQASVKMASAGRRKEKCKKIVEEPRKPLDFLRGSWTFFKPFPPLPFPSAVRHSSVSLI